MATRFGRVLQADVGVTLSQDRMQEVTDFIEKSLIVDGVLLKDIALKTGIKETDSIRSVCSRSYAEDSGFVF